MPFVAGENSEKEAVLLLDSLKYIIEYNGLSFDSLAKTYSHDPGTSPGGGYLGFTTRGSLVREFEQAAYSLSLNEISDPIRSSFGYLCPCLEFENVLGIQDYVLLEICSFLGKLPTCRGARVPHQCSVDPKRKCLKTFELYMKY